jgi:tRNA nucleotidyltransferase (CCA-adding enzyme)
MRAEVNVARKIPRVLGDFAGKFREAGFSCYLVGGALRNIVLGREPSDFDIATDAKPADVIRIFKKVIPTGIKHGTVTVLFKSLELETTTFRSEGGYSDGRHPDEVSFSKDILEDLKRRDFTMNGLAYDLNSGRLEDPHGGIEDIRAGLIRAIGEPAERFEEDGLRPLRAVRFASQLGFKIEGATYAAIRPCLPRTALVSKERVRDEVDKILLSPVPSYGLGLMEGAGLLELLLPELSTCRGVEQKGYHRFDVLDHSMLSCDGAPPVLRLRMAALLHDLGKPECRAIGRLGEYTFYGHEEVSARTASAMLARLRYPKKFEEAVVHLIRHHMFHYEESWTDAAVRRFIARAGAENIPDIFDLRRADAYGTTGIAAEPGLLAEFESRIAKALEERNAFGLRELDVNGNDLLAIGIPKGKAMGRILAELLESVLDDPELNRKDRLLYIAERLKEKYGIA